MLSLSKSRIVLNLDDVSTSTLLRRWLPRRRLHYVERAPRPSRFLRKNEISRIDTARRYPVVNSGRSEQLLGEVNAAGQDFTIDTKIKVVGSDAKGSLTAVKIKESVAESPEALQVDEVCFQPKR